MKIRGGSRPDAPHAAGAASVRGSPHARDALRGEAIARWTVATSTLWFAIANGWGLFARIGAGHDAVVAARAIIADNMLTWRIAQPVRDYLLQPPATNQYYVHHPWGTFWIIAAFAAALGRHGYVPRLVAVLMSSATPPLVYGVGRALWGPLPGALAALAYVTLPITLAFGNFPGFEVPLIFWCLVTSWGFLRWTEGGERRWVLLSIAGVIASVHTDWEAQIFLGVLLAGWTVAVFFVPRRWGLRVPERRFGQWASCAAALAAITVAGYLVYFRHVDALAELLAGEAQRSKGNDTPLATVLDLRRYWINLTFTPLAVLVGKAAVPVFLVRVLVFRRWTEIVAIALLCMAGFEYVVFKNGADVHIYWPLPFAPYYALSVGVTAAALHDAARAVLTLARPGPPASTLPVSVFLAVAPIPLAILPDGIDALRYSRQTGGRFNERGARIYREVDKAEALEWMAVRMNGRGPVAVHAEMRPNWAQEWALGRPVVAAAAIPFMPAGPGDPRHFVGDLAHMPPGDQNRLFQFYAVTVVDHFVWADLTAPKRPADAYRFAVRPPTAIEWYFRWGVDPVRSVVPSAWATWEVRDQFGQEPNPAPPEPPVTLDDLRVAHNVAVTRGDLALAEHEEDELTRRIETRAATDLEGGTRLLGVRFSEGVAPVLELFFRAGAPVVDALEVRSAVVQRRMLSLVPMDPTTKLVAASIFPTTTEWKRGFIYVQRCEIVHRPGTEIFFGRVGRQIAGAGSDGAVRSEDIELLVLR